MDVTDGVRRGQLVLICGLVVMLAAMAGSLYGVFRLEEAFQNRRSGLSAQDSYDELSKKIKDWVIVSQNLDVEKVQREKESLESAIQMVGMNLSMNPEQEKAFGTIRSELSQVLRRSGPPDFEALARIESALEDLNRYEHANIERHGDAVVGYIDKVIVISIAALLIGVFLIGISLRAKSREDKAKTKMIEQLRILKEEADSSSKLKSKFLSTVSHEIRTPLNGIIGLSDILANSPPTLNQQAFARLIHQSGKTLLRIINDILDFSKIEAGKFELIAVSYSLASVADQVLFTLSPKAAEKSINLNYEIDASLPKLVVGDPDRISQVLFNLVGNAIKFTSVGGVILRMKMLSRSESEVIVQIVVDDTGIGIPSSDMQNLFTPFVQGNKIGTSGEPGTGLGLSISQSIIEAMGGKIEVRSDVGRGSQFSILLPFTNFTNEKIGVQPQFRISQEMTIQANIEPVKLNGKKPRILIVEDNPTNQVVAQTMLERLQIDYLTAANGQEALDILEECKVDLILMDCQMPILDGYLATQELRKRGDKTPVIAMTANAYGEDEVRCREVGMNGFLTKPFSVDGLRKELIRQFEVHQIMNLRTIAELESSFGLEGRKKVVSAFLSTTHFFRDTIASIDATQDLEAFRRLGHRFKAAALCVGGNEFSAICERIEALESKSDISSIKDLALDSIFRLEMILKEYS